ncbi:hypothetical protein LPTSP4_30210 [Leptospira ryugenii]|uniref:Lipoprotein n=1 Tax=Leptospira ryugenii TaxID=1917863 RepID=A0A2P2E3L3_9LEPT|nr:hypothetical protein [Leptospira ryugenii]GBF51483.1 hypothetical protein LPTSP4_30210 [Leptospira ryugenii]
MKPLQFLSFFILFLSLCVTSVFAQDTINSKELISDDKMECYSIPTEIDRLEYQKSLKCVSKDAICFIVEGFAMSCIPRNGRYPEQIPNLNPKPTN